MTNRAEEAPVGDSDGTASGQGPRRQAADAVHAVCPYLVSTDGDWRSIHPTRDHRCAALQPPVAPALSKQRTLCLLASHVECATYGAARDLRTGSSLGGAERDGLWPETGTPVLALEAAHGRVGVIGGSMRGGQALLVGLMVLAFLVLVIARTTPPSATGGPSSAQGGGGAATDASHTPSASLSPTASRTPTPTAPPSSTPAASPDASASPTARASASARPTGSTTYRVKSGDTLSAIATRFDTTVRKLKVANGLTANTIRPGQVLVIP